MTYIPFIIEGYGNEKLTNVFKPSHVECISRERVSTDLGFFHP